MTSKSSTATTQDFYRQRFKEGGLRVGLVNLGCARNLVDSQVLLGFWRKAGHAIVDVEEADVAVVNTCSFIQEAKEESLSVIQDLIDLKQEGRIRFILVAGCLAQRYGRILAQEMPEIDAVVGTPQYRKEGFGPMARLTPPHYAYVKICESCYNSCRFCIIPKIKGKFVSRSMESVIEEVKGLDREGVKEVNLIGQDITAYGMDLYREKKLAALLKELVRATKHIRWFRLLYTFPAHITDELIDTIAQEERICSYVDVPLQHISDHLLASMNRNITTDQTRRLIERMRRRIKNVCLRTTFIVGLPGETDRDFKELCRFVEETRFDKMGVFVYSREEGSPAASLPRQVPERIKRQRMKTLMALQQEISREKQHERIGRLEEVLIDEVDADGVGWGRTEHDAPEVDGGVRVFASQPLTVGGIVPVRITRAMEYDVEGIVP